MKITLRKCGLSVFYKEPSLRKLRRLRKPGGFNIPDIDGVSITTMGLESFTAEDDIFLDEDVLRGSHTPTDLIERDRELSEYQAALKPVIKGARPRNIFLYGQTGVGKTLATEMVMDQLQRDQAEYDHLEVKVVNVLCKPVSTSYQVAVKLVNEFRDINNRIASTGHTHDAVMEMLWQHIREMDATHVLFVLDEVDSIGNDDDILYQLPRCNDNNNVPVEDTKVGVVGISNDFTFRDNLSARVKDSLCDTEIHFPPYDASQLKNILSQRSEKAFVDDVLEDDVIPLCAAFAGQESGSARQALKLLFTAGDLARSQDDEKVTEDHVRDAEPLVRDSKVKDELRSLPTQSHLTLYAVWRLSQEQESPEDKIRSTNVYDKYEETAERVGADVKTDRTIRDRLSQLQLKGSLEVEERNRGPQGGSFFMYSIGDVRPTVIEEALKDQDRSAELFQQ